MIEIIICITIICLVVGTIARYRINESYRKIKELEDKLDEYYRKREERLNKEFSPQDPATDKKGDINFMYKWIREKSGK